jgi:hypothetical protein
LAAAFVFGTALFALISLAARYRVESRNLATELAVEMDAVSALAEGDDISIEEALVRLKAAGLGAVVLSEQTVGQLADVATLELRGANTLGEVAVSGSANAVTRFLRGVWVRFGNPGTPMPPQLGAQTDILVQKEDPALLRGVSVGLDPPRTALAQKLGLRIIARGDNPTGSDAHTVRETIAWFKESGASIFLPQGDQVLGRRDNLGVLIEALQASGILYASPEFTKLGGDANVIAKIPERTVRLHSAQAAELDKMTEQEAVERYVRAARERNIRILLLRPISQSAESALVSFESFVRAVGRRLELEGGKVGSAKPFETPVVPVWIFPAIGLCAAVVAFWSATLFFSSRTVLAIVALACLALGAGAVAPGIRGFTALMAAFSFPLAAYGFLDLLKHRNIALHVLTMAGICLSGGLALAGLLNELPYFVRADQFAGVKLAHFGPIFLAGLFLAMRLINWKSALQSPVTWLQAVLSIFLMVALAFMFLRTGNENPAAVSGLELRLRSLLDNVLPVRPRTKEFILGYPALIIGLGMLMMVRSGKGREELKGWTVLALMVGAIGLTSLVNTMAHLHTPLEVGLIRILVGLVLGGIIGAAAWAVLRMWLTKAER